MTLTKTQPRERRALLGAIHVLKRDLGLDDDTYRDALESLTGKRSAGDLSIDQLNTVRADFRRRLIDTGVRPRQTYHRYRAKLRALWISGYHLGVVRDRSDAALESFIERVTGLGSARWLHDETDANRAVEAVKAMLAREAGVTWLFNRNNPRLDVVEAQLAILADRGMDPEPIQPAAMSPQELDGLIVSLGNVIRALPGKS